MDDDGELTQERCGDSKAVKRNGDISSANGQESMGTCGESKHVVSYPMHAKSQLIEPPAASVVDCSGYA